MGPKLGEPRLLWRHGSQAPADKAQLLWCSTAKKLRQLQQQPIRLGAVFCYSRPRRPHRQPPLSELARSQGSRKQLHCSTATPQRPSLPACRRVPDACQVASDQST
jgi:hypothetical protein